MDDRTRDYLLGSDVTMSIFSEISIIISSICHFSTISMDHVRNF